MHPRDRVVATALAAVLAACGPGQATPSAEGADSAVHQTIEGAHAALTEQLIDRPGITGVGIGVCDGNPCIKVYVVARDVAVVSEIADNYGGFPVSVEVSGEIRGGSDDA